MYEDILVPTDGSASAENALEHALDIAGQYGADLHALYVVASSYTEAGPSHVATVEALEEHGDATLEDVADRARAAGIQVVTEQRHGEPHREIVDYADEQAVDMIVMGTHGRTGIERYLLGSVTEKVVRTSEAPVLTVRYQGEDDE